MGYQIKSILYASDLSARSPAVFRHAVGLAEKFGAKLHAVTVTLPTSELPWVEFVTRDTLEKVKTTGRERREAELKKYIDAFAEAHSEYDVKGVLASVKAHEGQPAKVILDAAKNTLADMIVMGSRGQSALGEIFVGSVAAKVTMKADIPVVLVPIDR